MSIRPWVNAMVGPAVALAKAGASADSAEEMKDTASVNAWRLHFLRIWFRNNVVELVSMIWVSGLMTTP